MLDFSTYQSPFTWRYGSEEMRQIFGEQHKYELWRKIWLALARAEHKAGLVTQEELADIEMHKKNIDIARILTLEKETKHDVVAAIREFAEQCPIGGGKIHLGATSMDVVDNADVLRNKEALQHIEQKVIHLLSRFAEKIELYKDVVSMGFTHLQPAEPTTVGYRLAFYAQDLLTDYSHLQFIQRTIKGKGMKGAVGTGASYVEILKGTTLSADELDRQVMEQLGLETDIITTQVYTRKYDFFLLSALASIASSCAKFAGDVRILQSPLVGEWAEPFGKKQVGSSAMPFKRNPITSEKVCSLARYLLTLPPILLENASVSYLERTLDDSANKRVVIPEAFLALDEILETTSRLIEGLVIDQQKIARNLSHYAPFSATEVLLVALVKKGADRQTMHELLRELSMQAWSAIREGKENPLVSLIQENKKISEYLKEKDIHACFDVSHHVGDAPERAYKIVKEIKKRFL